MSTPPSSIILKNDLPFNLDNTITHRPPKIARHTYKAIIVNGYTEHMKTCVNIQRMNDLKAHGL